MIYNGGGCFLIDLLLQMSDIVTSTVREDGRKIVAVSDKGVARRKAK